MTSLGRLLGFFVYIVLFLYFTSRVWTSWQRLQKKQVGTRIKRINANQVLYPSLTVCQYDKIVHETKVWFSEGYDRPLPENDIFKELTYWEARDGEDTQVKFTPDETSKGNVLSHFAILSIKDKFFVMQCVTFNPSAESETGPEHLVSMKLNMINISNAGNVTARRTVYTFAHNKDQMFTPSMRKIYGSEFQVLQLDNSARQLSQIFALSKTHWKTLNNEEEPCNATQYSDTSSCIAMYIDNKLSCYFPLYKNPSSKERCIEEDQIYQLFSELKKLQALDELGIYKKTGCLSSCEIDTHQITRRLMKQSTNTLMADNTLELNFIFESGHFVSMEQYMIYEFDSFIADIGGYLGLLLGQSLLGLYHVTFAQCIKCIDKGGIFM